MLLICPAGKSIFIFFFKKANIKKELIVAILTFDHQQKQQQQQSKSQVQHQPPAVEDSILDKTQEEVQVHHQEPTAAATVAPPPVQRVSAVSSLSSGPGVKRSPSMNDSHYMERASVAVHQVRCRQINLFSQQFAFFLFSNSPQK